MTAFSRRRSRVPGFVAIAAGVSLFVVRADNFGELHAKPGLKPFAFTNAPDALPNYLAGEKWGTEGENLHTMQRPLPPDESAQHLVLQPGFEPRLFAAEPDITKPITLAWDERGRLWIAETVDYPNEMQRPGEGRDRIKICEDTDGDGRADKFTVFADKLSVPTSLCFANGGLIVLEGGHTLFLKDTNGDDRADERRVLFSGWGTNDTHAAASNLHYGFDNWIWGVVGYSGFEGDVGGKHHKFGMGVYRFKPDGSAMEFISSSNNNTWGLGLSEDGVVFGSTANGNASWYMAIPNRFYEAVNGWTASRMESIADDQSIHPITAKVRQVDWHGRYTAGAGHALYTGRSYPREFWNRISFVTEPTGHLIGWFRLDPHGADFKAMNLGSFLASDDEWTAPIAAEVGPDGAVWMIDWYNYIVQHNPTPVGFKTGKGNAYETGLRDKRHGRIYRLVSTAGTPTKEPRLAGATPGALVAALTTDNLLWRMHAQRLLVERGKRDVVPALRELVADKSVDAIGLNPGAVHALWTLHGLGAVGDEALAALSHPSASVRRAAVEVLPRTAASAGAVNFGCCWDDRDPQVRLATLLALAEMPPSPISAVAARKKLAENGDDRWIREAAIALAARNGGVFLPQALTTPPVKSAAMAEAVAVVARHIANSEPEVAVANLERLSTADPEVAVAFLDGVNRGWPENRPPSADTGTSERLAAVMKALPDSAKDRLLVLARKWNQLGLFPEQLAATQQRLVTRIADGSAPDAERLEAARSLLRLADDAANVSAVLSQVSLQSIPALAAGFISSLGEARSSAAAAELVAQWKRFTPAQRRGVVAILLRRIEWSRALLDAVEKGEIRAADIGREQWQQLRSNPDRALAGRATQLNGGSVSADREPVLKLLLPVAKQRGDAVRGKEVFTANCAVCHLFYGQGGRVGPDLTGIRARPREDILTDILDPNRSVEANYVMWNVATKSGETFSGRLDTETQTSIELFDVLGQKHAVLRQDIATLESSTQSLMPVGFESLGETDLAALLEFLTEPNRDAAPK